MLHASVLLLLLLVVVAVVVVVSLSFLRRSIANDLLDLIYSIRDHHKGRRMSLVVQYFRFCYSLMSTLMT